MQVQAFVSVGENIHCTRIYKVDGLFVKPGPDGAYSVRYLTESGPRYMPVPESFRAGGDWANGRIKHCAAAIWQGVYGTGAAAEAGVDYLQSLARAQQAAGATYLDINVDEFSTDVAERVRLMQWTVRTVQEAVALPVSIDSSHSAILLAGLEAAESAHGRPMVNSVSLERRDAIELAARHGAVVIATAAGESGLPSTMEERLGNLNVLLPELRDRGFEDRSLHIDPLVFPISVDGGNGKRFLDTVRAIRDQYGSGVHIVAGLSNVSFGMPNRKLINQVFARLAVEHGADGGIVDPLQINPATLNALDTNAEPFRLARALLMGEDDFGMEFITAVREGRI